MPTREEEQAHKQRERREAWAEQGHRATAAQAYLGETLSGQIEAKLNELEQAHSAGSYQKLVGISGEIIALRQLKKKLERDQKVGEKAESKLTEE